MEKFIITGGKKLTGSIRLGGAKNASFKLMIAALLAKGESRLLNIPHIIDVQITRSIIENLGGKVRSAGERMLCIEAGKLKSHEIPQRFGKLSRASTMFTGPLLARFGEAVVPLPGGDKIGARPLDRHFAGLIALGASVKKRGSLVQITAKNLKGANFKFEKNTHTGTETLILAAVTAQGKTILENSALEPEIDDLISMLNNMGAKVRRRLNRRIEIIGVNKLHPTIHRIMPDRNESVSYACAAIATGGDIIVENARPEHLRAFLEVLEDAQGGFELGKFGIRFYKKQGLRATSVTTEPYPGFMTDWQPLWAVLMTQARGTSIIHEAVHNSRFQYVADLNKMCRRKITFFNPQVEDPERFYNFNLKDDEQTNYHAVKITGPTSLKSSKFKVHDLRAGATLVLASLIANGKSEIYGIDHIDRGYENLDGRLIDLGANIKRV